MEHPFPQLKILPLAQQMVWPKLSETPSHFVLYGGTGIALRLGHREVASLLDLAATKVKVIQERSEFKDYFDLPTPSSFIAGDVGRCMRCVWPRL